jgi:hypothetical protein
MTRHIMGVLLIFIGWQALLGTYMAVVDFKHYGLNGLVGIALWLAAALIYWRWFQGWLWHFTLAIFGPPALFAAAVWLLPR